MYKMRTAISKRLFMNDVLKFGKKLFTFSVVAVTIVWSMGLAALVPTAVHAEECPTLEAGDLFKVPGNSAVYLVSDDLGRKYFPSGREFKSWYTDFSGVVEIPATCGANYPSDGAVTFRPGSTLVKNTTFPSVYAITTGGELVHIPDEATASNIWGAGWASLVVDVADVFMDVYTDNGAEVGDMAVDGMLVKKAGDATVYHVVDGEYVEVEGDLSSATSDDVVELTDTVFNKLSMSGTTTTDSEIRGGASADNVEEVSGTLSVSLSASTPDSGKIVQSVNTDFAKFIFRAGSDADVKVNNVKIARKGLGATGDFASITLYDGSTKLGTTKASWSSDGTMSYNISGGWTIPAGTSKELTMVANVSTAGTYNALGISAVTLASGSVSGLPVYGNELNAVNVSVGTVTITDQGSAATKKIGSTDVTLAEFRLALSSVEDAKLRSITLKNKAASNNASDGDLANVYLYQGTTMLAGPVSMKSDKVTFEISEDSWFLVKKSKNQDFKVVGDIVDGNANTVEFVLDATTDLKMYGETYNSQLQVTSTNYNQATEGAIITISGSQLNLAYTGTPLDITDDKTDVEFGTLTLSSGNVDTKITNMILTIDETDGDSDATNNADIDEFELVAEDGTTYSGTMTNGGDTNANDETWTFTDEIYLEADQTMTLTMRGDVPASVGAEDSYKVTMTVNTTNLTAETVVAGDAVSNFSIGSFNGKLVTVKTPYLLVKPINMNNSLTAVVNQEDVVIYKGTLEAVSDTITLSRLKFEGGLSGTDNTLTIANLDSDNWASLGLYTVEGEPGSETYTLLQNENNADLTTGYVDFDSFTLDIEPGTANKVTFAVKGTVSATLDGSNTDVQAQLDTVTVKDSDGDSRNAQNSAGTTIEDSAELLTTTRYALGGTGILYTSFRTADAGYTKDRVLQAGDSAWVGKLRLRADYEDVKLIDLKLTNGSADDEDSVDSVCLYTDEAATSDNLVGCTTLDSNDIAFFDNLDYVVTQGTQDLYVYVTARAMSNAGLGTADSHDAVTFSIVTTSGHLTARGVDSNTDLSYGNSNGTAAAGEIVFDQDMDGTFDEAADEGGTDTTNTFYVAGTKITSVELVDSYGGEEVASSITGTGTTTIAILAVTVADTQNTDASGDTLKLGVDNLLFNITKFNDTGLNGGTIERINGDTGEVALTAAASSTGTGSLDVGGNWTLTGATSTSALSTDAWIDAGTTAYFVVKTDITALSTTSNETNWVKLSLDDVQGGANDANNNIDWYDGYNKSGTNFDYLFLDYTSVAGTKISAPTNN